LDNKNTRRVVSGLTRRLLRNGVGDLPEFEIESDSERVPVCAGCDLEKTKSKN